MEEAFSFRPLQAGVEVLEAYLPLGASIHEKRLTRQSMGKMIADKIGELDAWEMVPGPDREWVLRCRLIIYFTATSSFPMVRET
jgi:hypothetical protein